MSLTCLNQKWVTPEVGALIFFYDKMWDFDGGLRIDTRLPLKMSVWDLRLLEVVVVKIERTGSYFNFKGSIPYL